MLDNHFHSNENSRVENEGNINITFDNSAKRNRQKVSSEEISMIEGDSLAQTNQVSVRSMKSSDYSNYDIEIVDNRVSLENSIAKTEKTSKNISSEDISIQIDSENESANFSGTAQGSIKEKKKEIKKQDSFERKQRRDFRKKNNNKKFFIDRDQKEFVQKDDKSSKEKKEKSIKSDKKIIQETHFDEPSKKIQEEPNYDEMIEMNENFDDNINTFENQPNIFKSDKKSSHNKLMNKFAQQFTNLHNDVSAIRSKSDVSDIEINRKAIPKFSKNRKKSIKRSKKSKKIPLQTTRTIIN